MILIACLRIGLTLCDIDEMDIGQILDIITTYNNTVASSDSSNSATVRNATQADFDRF